MMNNEPNGQINAQGGGYGPPGGFGGPPPGGFGGPPQGAPPGGFGGPPPGAPPGGFGGPPPGGFGGPPQGAPPGGFGGPPQGAPPGGFGGPPPGGPAPYGAPPAQMGPRSNHTLAIVSIVAAVAGWFFCYLIGPIVAIVTGMMAKKEIKANPEKFDGAGLATAGIVIGAINLGLSVIGFLIWLIMIIVSQL